MLTAEVDFYTINVALAHIVLREYPVLAGDPVRRSQGYIWARLPPYLEDRGIRVD